MAPKHDERAKTIATIVNKHLKKALLELHAEDLLEGPEDSQRLIDIMIQHVAAMTFQLRNIPMMPRTLLDCAFDQLKSRDG
jgi:hypothetical protein